MRKTITNQELLENLTQYLRTIGDETTQNAKAKLYITGASVVLRSIKMDSELSTKLGRPIPKRVREFLGEE